MSSNILLLSAHPNIGGSKACAAMLEAVKELKNVKVVDIYNTPLEVENYIDDVKTPMCSCSNSHFGGEVPPVASKTGLTHSCSDLWKIPV